MGSRLIPKVEDSSSRATSTWSSTIGDPQREAVRRLRLLSLAATIVPSLFLVFVSILSPVGSPIREARALTLTVIGSAVLLSVGVNFALSRESISLPRRLDIGFGYEVGIALLLATMRHSIPWAPGDGFREVSPVAILILLFAALIPNPPRRTLLVSLLAASMEPVGLAISIARGNPVPAPAQIMAICAGPLFTAIVSAFISRVIYGLARSVDAARRMGSYRLVALLGKGGMGEVWRGEHDLLARPAAIKLIRPNEGRASTHELKRFEREAQATATLRSPHTIQLYDFGVAEGGTFYYVMELLDGVDLDRLVRETGPMPAARVIHVMRQVCKSLNEAHSLGLVHRDVKPANIFLCRYAEEQDFVKVLDFGLVKSVDKGETKAEPGMTNANAVLGTPTYMAPEMVLGGTVDARADIYALGCVAYWLLTGRLVFEADSVVKVLVQ
ncbi:MAG: serine/threonine protein kinase, partial [Polyangiaceae bacterium]|nr:serine/threonine protein kinase [Polyangiaceae bacterium]